MGNCVSETDSSNSESRSNRNPSVVESANSAPPQVHDERTCEPQPPPQSHDHGESGTVRTSAVNPLSVGPHSSCASSVAETTCATSATEAPPSLPPRTLLGEDEAEGAGMVPAPVPLGARRHSSKNFRPRPAAASFTSTVVRASVVTVPSRISGVGNGRVACAAGVDAECALPDFDLGGPSRMGSTSASGPRNLSRTASEVSDGDDEVRRASTEMLSAKEQKDSRVSSTGLAALGTHTQSFVVHDSKLLHHLNTSTEQSTSSRSRSSGAAKHQSGSSLVAPPSVTSTQVGVGDDATSSNGSADASTGRFVAQPLPISEDNALIPRGVPSFFGEASLREAAWEAAATIASTQL